MRTLLIANRGEIAIRAARAARELGVTSIAVYAPEDRSALHRLIADRAYEIGEPGHPVRSYLDIPTLIATAREAGADAVYPGYGFLSESAPFAEACREAGLIFVGPSPETLRVAGDKVQGRLAAQRAGVPVLRASGPVIDAVAAREAAAEVGFPLFIKASAGGGGRGMRFVESADDLDFAVESARREAEAAFGDPTVFFEQAVIRPRHVEIQVLADGTGDVIHLFERDCSVQRRHQKVVEIAPAPNLPVALLDRLAQDAVAFAREVDYCGAGTVEFLVWPDSAGIEGYSYAFIEMNPRIQVEHTVTEEVTGVDLVLAQLQIASGATLADLGLAQPEHRPTRTAVQCRLTTEDPADGFRPMYSGPGGLVAHECILDIRPITKETGVTVDDIAKRLIDYGFHAPTMSFPVAGTLMIEPTESEGLAELDRFCDAMLAIRAEIDRVAAGEWAVEDSPLRHAPHTAECLVGEWNLPYDRATAGFPVDSLRGRKYWPPVRRIDGAFGDRHLVCSCPAPEELAMA